MNNEPKFTLTPWRVVKTDMGSYQVWTRFDDAPGSLNNYVVADGIQTKEEATVCAASPELVKALEMAKQTLECYPPLEPGNRQENTLTAINDVLAQLKKTN